MDTQHSSRRMERERHTLEVMVRLYCRLSHGDGAKACDECQQLLDYALERIATCPWGVEKPTCANCAVHCYRSEERRQILERMRFAGPRMLRYHPVLAILHLLDKRRASDLKALRGHRQRRSLQANTT